MRAIGSLHPTEGIPYSPDIVGVVIGSSVLAVVANDYPAASLATASSRPHVMRMTGQVPFYFMDGSTNAAIPTTLTTTPGSTANSVRVGTSSAAVVERWYQIPGGSTGYSMAFETSGIVTIEFFRKGSP